MFWLALAVCTGFAMAAGAIDGGSLTAALIAARPRMRSRLSFVILVVAMISMPFVIGLRVATTVSTSIVDLRQAGVYCLTAGVAGSLITLTGCLRRGIPVSSSVALVASLVGAAFGTSSAQYVVWRGVALVLGGIVLATVLGTLGGYLVYGLLRAALGRLTLAQGERFMRLLYLTSGSMGSAYGANDAQKFIGLFSSAFWAAAYVPRGQVPWWVVVLAETAFMAGMLLGARKTLLTVGKGIFRMRSVHGLAVQLVTVCIMLGGAGLGAPLSTTQTSIAATFGVGLSHRRGAVRFNTVYRLLISWAVSVPAGFVAGLGFGFIFRFFA